MTKPLRVPKWEPMGQEVDRCIKLGLELLEPEALVDSRLMLFKGVPTVASLILYWHPGQESHCCDDPGFDEMIAEATKRHGVTIKHYMGGDIQEYESGAVREEVLLRILPDRRLR
jgi:hypothetical protein